MAPFPSPRTSLLGTAILIFLIAIAATVMRRCDAPLKSLAAPPTRSPAPPIEDSKIPEGGEDRSVPLPTAEGPAKSSSKPEGKKRVVHVSDIFGARVKGARIAVTRSDGGGTGHWFTGPEGVLEIPLDAWEESFLNCGDFHQQVKSIRPDIPFEIPGRSGAGYGELCIVPLE